MTPIEMSADILKRNLDMLNGTLGDFSEADFHTRPCPAPITPPGRSGI